MEQAIRPSILNPIRSIQQSGEDGGGETQNIHCLDIGGGVAVDRQSVQYLADFLRGDGHEVSELGIHYLTLLQPSDGGLDVLCDLFANNTTLTKVRLTYCDFGTAEEASRLVAALQTNRTVTDVTIIHGIRNLGGAPLSNCISGLLQNMPQLQRLKLGYFGAGAVPSLQPGLGTNRTLKELDLSHCLIREDELRLVVDALVGNATMEVLTISGNCSSPHALHENITRLVEFTQLKKIVVDDRNLFAVQDSVDVKNFTSVLKQHTSLEEFPGLDLGRFPEIRSILARNVSMHRANALLALQPRTGMPIGSKSGIWYKAMAKFAEQGSDQVQSDEESEDTDDNMDSDADTVSGEEHGSDEDEVQTDEEEDDNEMNDSDANSPSVEEQSSKDELNSCNEEEDDDDAGNGVHSDDVVATYPGASAIFMILHTRHAILEKQLKRPATRPEPQPPDTKGGDSEHSTRKSLEAAEPKGGQKRFRLV